jgi:hypothetical protein
VSQQQIIQLIIIALVAGSSGLGWVLRKLKEHADKRAREQSMDRRKLESLRTGREMNEEPAAQAGMGGPAPVSQRSQQASEIADRRKRQLEELRKRQLARTQRSDEGGGGSVFVPPAPSGNRPTPRAMPRSIPGTSGTTVPIPQDRGGKQAGQSGGRQQRQRDRGGQRGPAPVVQQQREAMRQEPRAVQQRMDAPQRSDVPGRAAALKSGEEDSQSIGTGINSASASIASVMAEMDARRGQKQAMLGGKPITREDWRRAIVMNEILSTPVSLREPE